MKLWKFGLENWYCLFPEWLFAEMNFEHSQNKIDKLFFIVEIEWYKNETLKIRFWKLYFFSKMYFAPKIFLSEIYLTNEKIHLYWTPWNTVLDQNWTISYGWNINRYWQISGAWARLISRKLISNKFPKYHFEEFPFFLNQ